MKAWPYLAKARHPTLGCDALLWHYVFVKSNAMEVVGPFAHIEGLWLHCCDRGIELLRFFALEAFGPQKGLSLADLTYRSGAMGDPLNRDEWPIDLVLEDG